MRAGEQPQMYRNWKKNGSRWHRALALFKRDDMVIFNTEKEDTFSLHFQWLSLSFLFSFRLVILRNFGEILPRHAQMENPSLRRAKTDRLCDLE